MTDGTDEDRFATGGAFDVFATVAQPATELLIGRELGDYRVTGLIAEGGMGRVYRAERTDGSFERDVAVKVSPISGLDSRMRSRFAAEQSILASLSHPHVCQLFDAGITDEGWPYIVMELVDGLTIEDHVKASHLSRRARLTMLVDMVDAVAYAHARLIVHRDIKPSNIIVGSDDRARLLDFGIAQLLENDATRLTQVGAMTPRYASPEQLLGQPVTIASDIYQLGLLIFEVLTGTPVRQEETLTDAIRYAATGQSIKLPDDVGASMDRELQLVINQCLRHEPEERYRDVNKLREDLVAYLDGYPVAAAGRSGLYRLRKFVTRNLAATSIATVAAVALAGSAVWYTAEITEQRDYAQQQTRFAEESLEFLAGTFEAADPDNAQGQELSALDVLDLGLERVDNELADAPDIQGRLYLAIGKTYYRLGKLDEAEAATRRYLETSGSKAFADDISDIRARSLLANIVADQGREDEALAMLEVLNDEAVAALGPENIETLKVQNNLAISYWATGDFERAEALYQSVYDTKVEQFGRGAETTLSTAVNLSQLLVTVGRAEDSVTFTRSGLGYAEDSLGRMHPITIDLLYNLANAAYASSSVSRDDVVAYFEDVVTRSAVLLGEESFDFAARQAMLGAILVDTGHAEEGIEVLEESLVQLIDLRGEEHRRVMVARGNYAAALNLVGRYDEAMEMLPDMIRIQTQNSGANHTNTLFSHIALAQAMHGLDRPDTTAYVRELEGDIVDAHGSDHWLYKELLPLIESASVQESSSN